MPRVFHLIKSLGRGGAEMLLAEGLRFADRDRFTYGYGFFLPWKDAMVPTLRAQGVDVVCFDARSNLSILLTAGRVAKHIRRWNGDLLHCHLPIAGAVGRLAGKMSGVPVVYTEHNKMERYHPLTRRLNLLTWRYQDQVIAVSREVAASIRSHTSVQVPIEVVLNGVDVVRFDRDRIDASAVREEWDIPADAPVVGTVAVFRAQKGLDDWLTAARLLRDRHPDVHFLLVGAGPLRDEVASRSISLGLEDVVHLPGMQPDVRPYLAAMDVYMVSSVFEGLPLALLEAMAMQCPVVATRVGGIPEVIELGQNGYLVDSRQPEVLARVASELLAAPEIRLRFGRAARRTIENRFSLPGMIGRLEATYLAVLDNAGNGR